MEPNQRFLPAPGAEPGLAMDAQTGQLCLSATPDLLRKKYAHLKECSALLGASFGRAMQLTTSDSNSIGAGRTDVETTCS